MPIGPFLEMGPFLETGPFLDRSPPISHFPQVMCCEPQILVCAPLAPRQLQMIRCLTK